MNLELELPLWDRQAELLHSEATEILFGGATEGGKSHALRVVFIALCLAIDGLQAVLIRKKYDDILKNHVEGPTGFKQLLAPLMKVPGFKITDSGISFPNGSNIAFQHCQDERQFISAQGVEKHLLGIDEATQIGERLIRFFRAWVRMPLEMQAKLPPEYRGKLPLIIYTANPIGASVGYFRRNFVKARAPFAIEEVNGFKRQYIPSRAVDNPSVDLKAHSGRLADIDDPGLAKALDEGDWDAPIGDFIRQWDDTKHKTRDFIPPAHWYIWRSFDWGGADPAAVGWFTVSDGEEFIDHMGRKRWFPRGAVVMFREWYICAEHDPSKGIDLPNREIAEGVVRRTPEDQRGMVTVTDSLPFQKRGAELMADEFARHGMKLEMGNTARIVGWKQLKDFLTGKDGWPYFYVTDSCKYAAEYIPMLQRHKTNIEDAEESGEATHMCDMIRLALMTRPPIKSAPAPSVAPKFPPANISLSPQKIVAKINRRSTSGGFTRR